MSEDTLAKEEMMTAKLQGKVRGDIEWSDMESAYPQHDLAAIIEKMKGHGFKVVETDAKVKVVNPLTKQVECEYRLW